MPVVRRTIGPLELPVLTGPLSTSPPVSTPRPTGTRVTLRPFCPADVVLVQSAAQDPLIPLITSVPSTPGRAEALAYIERQHQRARSGEGWSFAIADAETGTGVGQIGLWPGQSLRRTGNPDTIGYWIGPEHRKRGYAGAALALLTEWAVTVQQMPRIELYIEPWNKGSWRAAENAGYTRDVLLPAWQKVGTQWRDMYRYAWTAGTALRTPGEAPRKTGPKIG
ncbi:GNAT family N-acetyltransferase [Arthrobacter jiangjiafuii]|uniref:GNAT family N-acetyltransferase n=1 Tax=Arthrobacter jiangjiafuii TaxID=2817475 RepID=A0A975M5C2_9MICC|nr:GNAT family N-acetyltransferase [Arthrobacter jiangjiafuii]QWC10273.1 GNAT family N-acetyltransferase [Arthrobacter jiangjiafuii]